MDIEDHAGHDHPAHGHAPHAHAGHAHDGHAHDGHAHAGHAHGALGHVHAASFGAAFAVAIGLNALIVVAELVSGLAGHSVALLADAGHNLSDVLALCAAFAASRLGRRAPSPRFTYGLGGTSILAALFNAVALLVVTGALGLEAVQRLLAPRPVAAGLVMAVAAAAIVGNGVSALLLARGQRGHGGDLNTRAAVAHLAADAATAAGVVVGAVLITLTGWDWIDPVLTLAIAAVIVAGTWRLLREALALSLAGVPGAIEPEAVRATLAALPGVARLHDLHIWPVSVSETALTAHLVMPGGHPGDAFLMDACRTLREVHDIGHATLQVETSLDTACALAPETVV